jgi:hypothetical protein
MLIRLVLQLIGEEHGILKTIRDTFAHSWAGLLWSIEKLFVGPLDRPSGGRLASLAPRPPQEGGFPDRPAVAAKNLIDSMRATLL